jgi:uncharacterized membrane protein YedE/YeeE
MIMKFVKFLLVGALFGIILSKSEVVSWYRIFEMFRFESFHMYGIIGSAVGLGMLAVYLIKKYEIKSITGEKITLTPKEKGFYRYIIGGIIFGLGWAMSGACPGPMFILLGNGILSIGIVILGALFGTLLYGILMKKLPH